MKHLLSIEQTSREEIDRILRRTAEFKTNRGRISSRPLAGQTWTLIFSKPSTRTRVSFEVGIRELGGESIYRTAAAPPTQRNHGSSPPASSALNCVSRHPNAINRTRTC